MPLLNAPNPLPLWLNGQTVASQGPSLANHSPIDGTFINHLPQATVAEVDAAVQAAQAAYPLWRSTPAPQRAEVLYALADLLKRDKTNLAHTLSWEMGKSWDEAGGDVQEAIDMALYMAGEGRRLLGHTTPSELPHKWTLTQRCPVGVCALITPWNFPIAVPSWKLLPALMAGNTVVWKPSEQAPLVAHHVMCLLQEAGLPAGVVNLVHGGASTGEALSGHPQVRLVSFTGSSATGAQVASVCGAQLKRCVLELGGNNPAVVLEDADLDLAATGLVWGAFATSGQRCTATRRVYVHHRVQEAFTHKLLAATAALTVGDPQQAGNVVGPLISSAAVQRATQWVATAQAQGAQVLCGGQVMDAVAGGHYFAPTWLAVPVTAAQAPYLQEECFAPIASVIGIASWQEGLALANATRYGLSAAVYTANLGLALRMTEGFEAGLTYMNAPNVGAEVHLPFGGVKASGNGWREAGLAGLDAFCEWKTVAIDYSNTLQRAQMES